jgi:predicted AlkP superfamily phosphohydrolase/phosphomutase
MPKAPLVVLVLDTGDTEMVDRWVAEGRLPALGALRERGLWGTTGGPETVCEYGMGLTLFSGVSRRDHGYYYFRQLRPGTYDLQTMRPPDVPPFWATLTASGERALIVDVPDIRPVRGLPGLQLSDWATHHGSVNEPEAEPAELLDRVRSVFGHRIVIHGKRDSTPEEDLDIHARLLDKVRKKGALCRHLLDDGPFDVVVIGFSETDLASHQFWRYRGESGGTSLDTPLRHGIRDVYEAVDAEMGRLLARMPEANAFIVSLYGIQDQYPTSTLIESFLERLGYHVPVADGAKRRSRPLALIRTLVPESLRRRISRRLPASAQEELLARKLRQETDWSRTTAFAVPSLFTSFVRVNLEGREPQGIVGLGSEYRALLDRIEEDLGKLTEWDTGKPVVERVSRTTELFGGEPPEVLPDLFVEWKAGPRLLSRVRHPRAALYQPRPAYCPDSQEKLFGFVAGAGPGIPPAGNVGQIDLLDLAPTFLSLLGRPVPPSMGGRPIQVLAES